MKSFSFDKISEFKCIGSECPDTCCAGWDNIPIDHETYKYYQTLNTKLGDELRNRIARKDSKAPHFIIDEKGRCPFLNDVNLCKLVLSLGEDKLCYTCHTYPRKKEVFGNIVFLWLSVSCPEVARQLLSKSEPLIPDLSDYEESDIKEQENYDRKLFDIFVASYADCIGILQERSLSIGERITVCLLFIYQIESNIKTGTDVSGLLELFAKPDSLHSLVSQLDTTVDITSKIRLFNLLYKAMGESGFKRYDNLYELFEKFVPYFRNNDMSGVLDELFKYYSCFKADSLQTELEQLLVYCFTHYFFKDNDRKCFMRNISFIIVLLQTYICFTVFSSVETGSFVSFEERVLFISRLSRLFEHNQTIMDDIYTRLEMFDMNSLSYLLRLASI